MKNKKLLMLAAFVLCNFMLTLVLGIQYFGFIGGHPAEILFAAVAHVSNTAMIYAVLVPLLLFLYFARAPKIVFIAIFFTVNILAFTDAGIYKIFRFHVNGLVLNTLITQGGWESLDFSRSTKIFFVLLAASVFFAEALLYNFLAGFFCEERIRRR